LVGWWSQEDEKAGRGGHVTRIAKQIPFEQLQVNLSLRFNWTLCHEDVLESGCSSPHTPDRGTWRSQDSIKMDLRKNRIWGCRVFSSGTGWGSVVSSCGHGNETSDSIIGHWGTTSSWRTLLHGVTSFWVYIHWVGSEHMLRVFISSRFFILQD
jgi:hypothetical protein